MLATKITVIIGEEERLELADHDDVDLTSPEAAGLERVRVSQQVRVIPSLLSTHFLKLIRRSKGNLAYCR